MSQLKLFHTNPQFFGPILRFSAIFVMALGSSCAQTGVKTDSADPHHPPGEAGVLAKTSAEVQAPEDLRLQSGAFGYRVLVHSPTVRPLIKGHYSFAEIEQMIKTLNEKLVIDLTDRGLVKAANRDLEGEKDATNYDAIWLRDSLWVYLGLSSTKAAIAPVVLQRMFDYLASNDQLRRMEKVIANPSVIKAKDGNMQVIHIRFNGASGTFEDVFEQGRPQNWNHKQNDALGLFYDLALKALSHGEVSPAQLTGPQWRMLTGLPCYFDAVKFYEMEDAGPWEEIDRVNTSSISLVTSGLENLSNVIRSNSTFAKEFLRQAGKIGYARCASREVLNKLIAKGYDRIHRQIAAGGESPLYPLNSPKYRRADAALYNALYPAQLSQLTPTEREAILAINQPLIGRVGIKRYLFDSYQSGNFWRPETASPSFPLSADESGKPAADESGKTAADSRTDDTSSDESFALRGSKFIADTEAQWFFDSWLSVIYGRLYLTSKKRSHLDLEIYHLNRALGQLTAGSAKMRTLGADGKPVPFMIPPESYNQLVDGATQRFVPSPIAPLNWAKASLLMALHQLRENLR